MPNNKADQFRLRVRYSKHDRLAHLGHLEVINTINRCVRRSGLPFAVGNGFARRIRLQFSQALPVGASSAGEFFDLLLTERVDAQDALAALKRSTPPALAPLQSGYVAHELPALEAWLTRSSWGVTLLDDADVAAFMGAIGLLREQGSLCYDRNGKPRRIDLASSLVSVEPRPSGMGFLLDCRSSNEGSLRPATLVAAAARSLGQETPALRVCRLCQWHEEDGRLVEALPRA
ncbi:TIGR03936 family radical SAM-associated protein [Olsenella urininfantis]|uniref:TIGR03936 family radical SAM-associated protein n=1 Tax=Olsenella urininfantis TaxID=1871033 RepID=UPI000987D29C|nr:TIGR03936 family radical SAM-associated protein [Olsenella urininfantis]